MSQAKSKLIQHAKIDWSDQSEPYSPEFQDVYFNTEQGLSESLYVFFTGNDLATRWLDCTESFFSIAETGFGTGLNFLITCLEFEKFKQENPNAPLQRLHFTSFEMYPLSFADLQQALQRWPLLKDFISPLLAQYPLPLAGCHRIILEQFDITLDLWFGDVKNTLPELYCYQTGIFDCWYLDGFAPSKNPDMWSDDLFAQIAESCKNNATIATFSAAGFVRRGLESVGFSMIKRKGYGKKREMLVGQFQKADLSRVYGQHYRPSTTTNSKDIAIIGGGLSSACLSLALIKRGYKVTLYCKDKQLASGASGNQQGALYPLLNQDHNALSQFFANAFLFSRNYVEQLQQSRPFDYDLSGLLQLYYDQSSTKKLQQILQAQLPEELVHQVSPLQCNNIANLQIDQAALYYPLAGWLSPQQMVNAIFAKAKQLGDLTIHLNHKLQEFTASPNGYKLQFTQQQEHEHALLIFACGFDTLNIAQCAAIPLSAARGQVTHIPSHEPLSHLQVTLCHEGYLTPTLNGKHCMGASFKRHVVDDSFAQEEQRENKLKLQKCLHNKLWTREVDSDHQDAHVGIRSTTRDHFPYVGALANYEATKALYQNADKSLPTDNAPFYENVFILTGLGSRGLCSAPLAAELLASQIEQSPLPLSKNILNAMQTNRQWVNYLRKGKKMQI